MLRLRLASPEEVRGWSAGEVTQPQTYHPRSGKPMPGGLFCETIFGPLVAWRCRCGELAGTRQRHKRCGQCGKPVLQRRVRRERMGHVDLAAPVAHVWYVRARPSPLAQLLDLEPGEVERVVYGEAYLVVSSDEKRLSVGRVLDPIQLDRARQRHGQSFTVEWGAVALQRLLAGLAPPPAGAVNPAWMILTVLPVVSPALRPVVRLHSGRQASSELNDLYRRVIRCNNALKDALKDDAPSAILREGRLALQHAVDALLDNGRSRVPLLGPRRRPIKSLSDGLSGKQGRFRGHLLGKRVDYSGRSVIVVGPELKLHQCGLPLGMALELFEPLLLGELLRQGWASTLRRGRQLLDSLAQPDTLIDHARLIVGELLRQRDVSQGQVRDSGEARARGRVLLDELPTPQAIDEVRDCLQRQGRAAARRFALRILEARQTHLRALIEHVVAGHPVLLNRAPTLHRMGIQAFEPVLVEGDAIRLHPLVCKGFNADFDGDQMAVHVPLSEDAIREALTLMTPAANLLNPASGQLIVSASQDIVLGCYYLTTTLPEPTTPRVSDGPLRPVAFTPPVTDNGSGRMFASRDEVLRAYEADKVGTHARIRLRHRGGKVLQERGDQEDVEDLKSGTLLTTTVGRVVFNAELPAELPFYNLTLDSRRLMLLFRECRHRLGQRGAVEVIDRVKQIGFTYATRGGTSFATDDVPVPPEKPAILAEANRKVETLRRAREEGSVDDDEYAHALRETWAKAQKDITEPLRRLLRDDTREGRLYLNPLHAMADSKARGSIDQIRQLAGMRGLMASVSGKVIDRPITASLREGLSSWDYFVSAYGGRKGLTDKGVRTADAGYLTRKLVACCQRVVVTQADCGTKQGIVKRVHKGTLASRVEGRVSLETVRDEAGEELVRAGELVSAGQARGLAALELQELRVRSPLTCATPGGVCQQCYGLDLSTRRLVALGSPVGIIAAQSIGEPGTQLTLRTFQTGGVAGKDIVNDLERVTRFLEVSRPVAGEVDLRELFKEKGREAVADYLLTQVRELYRVHGLQIDDRHLEVVLAQMLRKDGLLGVSQVASRAEGFLAAASFGRAIQVLTEAALAGRVDRLCGLMEHVILGRAIPAGTGFSSEGRHE